MLHQNFLAIAARAPSGNGLRANGFTHTYSALAERIPRLAAGLQERGVGAGDAVAIQVHNGPELFALVHALFALGAVAMPLSPAATVAEVIAGVRKAGARLLVVETQLVPHAETVATETGTVAVLTTADLEALARTQPITLAQVAGDADALFLLSSGSTGLPKIVPHTHAELLADAKRTSAVWQVTADDVVFDMLPPNFAMGLLLGATNAAQAGATTVYWHDARPLMLARKAALETIVGEGVTFMGAVPAMYESLSGAARDRELRGLRQAFTGGAALKRGQFEAVRDRLGLTLRQSYGSTEALMVAHNTADDPDGTWSSVGRPAGDAVARIASGDYGLGDDAGELLLKTSSMTRGYLDDDAANAASFEDGWLRTGDLARIDETGGITILGRSKLLIEVAGFKIDPIEVEDALLHHPAVAEVAVVGERDRSDQRLKAIVVRGGEVTPEALSRHVRGLLSSQKVPTLYEFRDSLPRSATGKLLRGKL